MKELFLTLLTNAVFWGVVWKFYTRKAAKLIEEQKARQEKNVADKGEFENLITRMNYLEQKLKEGDYERNNLSKKVYGLQKFLTIQIGYKKSAENKICNILECEERVPDLGTYQTNDEYKEQTNEKV